MDVMYVEQRTCPKSSTWSDKLLGNEFHLTGTEIANLEAQGGTVTTGGGATTDTSDADAEAAA